MGVYMGYSSGDSDYFIESVVEPGVGYDITHGYWGVSSECVYCARGS